MVSHHFPYRIYPLGDQALTIQWGDRIHPDIHQQVTQLYHLLTKLDVPYIRDLIPAYSALTIVYDTVSIRKSQPSAFEWIRNLVIRAIEQAPEHDPPASKEVVIPVCYDPSLALDLEELSRQKNLSPETIIALHCSTTYLVYMIGFLPGFSYMGSVDPQLITPRKAQPRIKVPAGSVGIAGEQTGIYPFESPGGWNIIGQTPLALFEARRDQPALLETGDRIRFVPIDIHTFHQLKSTP